MKSEAEKAGGNREDKLRIETKCEKRKSNTVGSGKTLHYSSTVPQLQQQQQLAPVTGCVY